MLLANRCHNKIVARFKNRSEAGCELLLKLLKYKNDPNVVVVGLLRGGIVTAAEIARGLSLPLGFLVVKKLGAPGDPELAVGAVTDNGGVYLDDDFIERTNIDRKSVDCEIERKKEEARRKYDLFSERVGNVDFKGKTVILVDDGIATGATMVAAVRSMGRHGARKVVVASPVGICSSVDVFRKEADEVVCLEEKLELGSVGEYYDEFPEVSDEEAIAILKGAKR